LSALASQCVGARRDAQEQARREAEAAARLTATVEAMADGVVVFDRDERARHVNAALRAFLALDDRPGAADRLAREWDSLLPVHDLEDRPLPPEAGPIRRVLRGETLTGPDAMDLRVRALDGREHEISVSGAPMRAPDGDLAGGVLDVRDVTERRRLERRTREALRGVLDMANALVPAAGEGMASPAATRLAGQRLVDLTRHILACHGVGLLALDPETGTLSPIAVAAPSDEDARRWWDQAVGTPLDGYQGLAEAARLRAGETIVRDRRHDRTPGHEALGGRALLLAPPRLGDTLVGLLHIEDGDTSRAIDERALVAAVAGLAALLNRA
jgi:hypothetical protein